MIDLLHGDCLELLTDIPDGSIDLVVTDPPYGDGIAYGNNNKKILNNEDESINYKVIPVLYDKLKDNSSMYLFTNRKFMCKIRGFVRNETDFNLKMCLVVVKNHFGFGYGFRSQHEICLVFEKGKPIYNFKNFSNVLRMEHIRHDKKSHPHEKGLEMIKKIISHSSLPGDMVLDCFAGSGTTGVACKELDRRCILMELDEQYVSMIKQRIGSKHLPKTSS